jgi:hypothetical protein
VRSGGLDVARLPTICSLAHQYFCAAPQPSPTLLIPWRVVIEHVFDRLKHQRRIIVYNVVADVG